jgi:ABC-type transport system involved in Fe-S cluster assembly fused permease/ATPase subunit
MIVNSFTDMENLFDLLAEVSTVQDLPNAIPLQLDPEGCEIEFDNVSFTYPRRGKPSHPIILTYKANLVITYLY